LFKSPRLRKSQCATTASRISTATGTSPTASGGRWDRPELHRLLDHLREGDTVVVWKLDRLSRSLKDVLHIMERIANAGAGFRSITENIDTTTPAGRMMMQMVGAFAEFERAMIRERTSAGLAAARAEGRVGGRRKKLDAGKRKEIAESVASGRKSGADMARLYNISQPTVSRWSKTISAPIRRPRSTRHFPPKKRAASQSGSNGATRPNMEAGSTWPNPNSAFCRANA
jgi:DNA invertase Pin-like site-specific DNA recombinase